MLLSRFATRISRAFWLPLLFWTATVLQGSTQTCTVLKARPQKLDASRIQAALNGCSPGKAVVLKADGTNAIFESAPLILPRGVNLFIDRPVTLYASKNSRDYDLSPNSCGAVPQGKTPNCKPFLFAYQAAYSGVSGNGTIDGQGSSWWSQNYPTVPDLVSSYESQGFQIDGVTLRNAAGVPAAIFKTIALRVSRVRIESTRSTGLLLSNSIDAEVNDSSIQVPAKSIVLTSSILGPTTNVRVQRTKVSSEMSVGDDVREVTLDGVCVSGKTLAAAACEMSFDPASRPSFDIDLTSIDHPGKKRSLIVKPGDSIQKAIDTLPLTGGDIAIRHLSRGRDHSQAACSPPRRRSFDDHDRIRKWGGQ